MRTVPILIVDTFADPEYLHAAWAQRLGRWAFAGMRFDRSPGAGTGKPHPHGWMCSSRIWPVIFDGTERDTEYHLHHYRWIDDPTDDAPMRLQDKTEELYAQYGCLVENCSWGGPPRGGDSITNRVYDNFFLPFCERRTAFAKEAPHYVCVQSAGNDGPLFGGSPVWQFHASEVWSVAAGQRNGRPAGWSCRNREQVCMSTGEHVAVADPFTGRWVYKSGTSFSGPDVAGMSAYFMHQGLSRQEIFDRLECHLDRPAGEQAWSDVWGHGNAKNLYQTLIAGKWERLGIPGPVRDAMAAMNVMRPIEPLPEPMCERGATEGG